MEGAYLEVRLISERVVTDDRGRMVEVFVEPLVKCPKSDMFGLCTPEVVKASLRRTRDDEGVCGVYVDEGRDSSYRVKESVVEMEVLGEPGLPFRCNS
jgi:hypothetical protein